MTVSCQDEKMMWAFRSSLSSPDICLREAPKRRLNGVSVAIINRCCLFAELEAVTRNVSYDLRYESSRDLRRRGQLWSAVFKVSHLDTDQVALPACVCVLERGPDTTHHGNRMEMGQLS